MSMNVGVFSGQAAAGDGNFSSVTTSGPPKRSVWHGLAALRRRVERSILIASGATLTAIFFGIRDGSRSAQ
jgi:hypothetical protein